MRKIKLANGELINRKELDMALKSYAITVGYSERGSKGIPDRNIQARHGIYILSPKKNELKNGINKRFVNKKCLTLKEHQYNPYKDNIFDYIDFEKRQLNGAIGKHFRIAKSEFYNNKKNYFDKEDRKLHNKNKRKRLIRRIIKNINRIEIGFFYIRIKKNPKYGFQYTGGILSEEAIRE